MHSDKFVAVVGCGYWGKNLVRNFAQLGVLRVICDASCATLSRLGDEYDVPGVTDFEQVLDMPDVQAVVIATPAPTHASLVLQALAAGKDVFVEKPLALTLQDAIAIQAALDKCDRILMVGHLLEYHPALVTLRDLVASGRIGKLQYLYSNRLSFGKVRTEENVLWSFAPHDICNILGFVGKLPRRVQAFGSNHISTVEDFCTINLEFPDNIKAHIFVSWLHPFKEHRLVVIGDAGMAVFDDVSTDAKLTVYPQRVTLEDYPIAHKGAKEVIPVPPAEPLLLECKHFLDCIQTRQQPITNIENGINVLSVLHSAQQSLNTHRVIDIKEKQVVSC